MNVFQLKGKGLFVFSDPGGAKPILALISLNPGLEEYKVISDRVYDFFDDFGIPVTSCTAGSEEEIIQKFQPDFIFTGTSYTSTIDLRFIKAAKKLKIQSYAFVDHYTNFLGRFQLNEEMVFPETICVLDELANEIAIESQPDASVIITSNYYHEYLKNWEVAMTKHAFLTEFNIPEKNKIIVFAPDPLTNIGGKIVFGLDEMSVWNAVKDAFELLKHKNYTLVIKFHPNQKQEPLRTVIENSGNKNIVFADEMHTNTLLYYADMVIGMFSNILIESLLLGTPVIRYLNGLKKTDPFAERSIGQVVDLKDELITEITKIF